MTSNVTTLSAAFAALSSRWDGKSLLAVSKWPTPLSSNRQDNLSKNSSHLAHFQLHLESALKLAACSSRVPQFCGSCEAVLSTCPTAPENQLDILYIF